MKVGDGVAGNTVAFGAAMEGSNPSPRAVKNHTRVAQVAERRQNMPKVGCSNHSPRTWKVKWAETLGKEECPYLKRWRFQTPWFSVRLHHFYRSDDKRAPHDHPFSFITLVLKGAYFDLGEQMVDHLRPGSLRYRPATHRHSVVVDYNDGTKFSSRYGRTNGVWTIILTGPMVRRWGFWVNGKFRKSNKYFLMYGHPACSER